MGSFFDDFCYGFYDDYVIMRRSQEQIVQNLIEPYDKTQFVFNFIL